MTQARMTDHVKMAAHAGMQDPLHDVAVDPLPRLEHGGNYPPRQLTVHLVEVLLRQLAYLQQEAAQVVLAACGQRSINDRPGTGFQTPVAALGGFSGFLSEWLKQGRQPLRI